MSDLIQMSQSAIDALVKEAFERGQAEGHWELARCREGWDNRAIEAEKLHHKISSLQLDLEATRKHAAELSAAYEPATQKIKQLTIVVNDLREALIQYARP